MSEFIVDNDGITSKTSDMEISDSLSQITTADILLPKSIQQALGAVTVLGTFTKSMSDYSESEQSAVCSAIKKSTTLSGPTLILSGLLIVGAIAFVYYKESKGQPVKKMSFDLKSGVKFSFEFDTSSKQA